MKKILLVTLMICSIIISGCSKEVEGLNKQQAKEELENHNYETALDLLSDVIDDDPKDNEARAMYTQARKMLNADKYEKKGYYEKAIIELEAVVKISEGSQVIKKTAENKRQELEKLKEEEEKVALQLKANAKESSKKDNQKADAQILYEQSKEVEEEESEVEEEEEVKTEEDLKEDLISN